MKPNVKQSVEGLLSPPVMEKPMEKPAEIPKPKAPEVKKRTLGSIYVALEAQRVYQPNQPSVPSPQTPQAPPANMQEMGTAPNLGTTGAWNQPEGK